MLSVRALGCCVALAAVTAIVVSSCAKPIEQSSVAPADTLSTSPAADAFFNRVADVEATLFGTPEERRTVELARDTLEQQAYVDCMRQAGFEYDVPNLIVAPGARYYSPSWWTNPSLDDATLGFGYAAPPAPVSTSKPNSYQSLSTSDKVSYDKALDACIATVENRPEMSAPLNAQAQKLTQSLNDALFAAALEPSFAELQSAYKRCMGGNGIDVAEPGALFDVAKTQLAKIGFFDVDPYSKEYQALIPDGKAIEVRLGSEDAECRAPLADGIAGQLSPVFDAWLTANATAVDATDTFWRSVSK